MGENSSRYLTAGDKIRKILVIIRIYNTTTALNYNFSYFHFCYVLDYVVKIKIQGPLEVLVQWLVPHMIIFADP
jgi:hypothetical protein